MRVKLLRQISGAEGSFLAGSEADLSENMATALVDGGYAERIGEPVNATAVEETAALAPAENTARSNPKPRKAR